MTKYTKDMLIASIKPQYSGFIWKVSEVSKDFYTIKLEVPYNPMIKPEMFMHFELDTMDHMYIVKNIIETKEDKPKCECGASKLGYSPGRSHSSWCIFYRE